MVLARLAQIKTMNLLAESRQVTLSEEEEAAVLSAAETYFSSLNDTEVEKLGLTEKKTQDMYREYALANKIYDLIIQDTDPEISDDGSKDCDAGADHDQDLFAGWRRQQNALHGCK